MRKKEFTFSFLIENFFTEYLVQQKQVSRHTVTSYRDTFRLLLPFIAATMKKNISNVGLEDLNVDNVMIFLNHLEKDRGCSARSRNQRLAAIKSFLKYTNIRLPDKSHQIHRVLSVSSKRITKKIVDFLTSEEIEALLKAPDRNTWFGRRDHTMILFAVETGLRVSEILQVKREDLQLDHHPHVFCLGKGRKERRTPLGKSSTAVLREWLKENPAETHVFLNRAGSEMSADAFQYALKKYQVIATKKCPSLKNKIISPHVLRHTTAMNLLQAGVDPAVIALWLGHSSIDTTMNDYITASLELKERSMIKMDPTQTTFKKYMPTNDVLTYLEGI